MRHPNEDGKLEEQEQKLPLYTFTLFSKSAKEKEHQSTARQTLTLSLHGIVLYFVSNEFSEFSQEEVAHIEVRIKENPRILYRKNEEGQTPLHLAAGGIAGLRFLKIFQKSLENIKELKEKTLSLTDEDGRTALDLLFLNIINNKKILTKDLEGNDFEELVVYFIKNGVHINLQLDGVEFLNGAAERGFNKIIEAIVKFQFNDFSAVDKAVFDKMHFSVKETFNCKNIFFKEVCRIISEEEQKISNEEVLAYVEEVGGEPMLLTFCDAENKTLLHWAAFKDRWNLVKQFIIRLHAINRLEVLCQEDSFNNTILDYYEKFIKNRNLIHIKELSGVRIIPHSVPSIHEWDLKKFLMYLDVRASASELKLDEVIAPQQDQTVFLSLYNGIVDPKISNMKIKEIIAQNQKVMTEVLCITDSKGRNLLHYAALYTRNNIFDAFLTILAQKSLSSLFNIKDFHKKTPLDYLLIKISSSNLNQFLIKDFEESLVKYIEMGARFHSYSFLAEKFFVHLTQLMVMGFSSETLRLIFRTCWQGLDDNTESSYKDDFMNKFTLEEQHGNSSAFQLSDILLPELPQSGKSHTP